MVNKLHLALAFILILVAAACTTPQVPGPGVAQPTYIPTFGVDEYNSRIATTDALAAAARATRDTIIFTETRVATDATAAAAAIATSTQAAADAAATATAAVEMATAEALTVRQTEVAMSMTGTAAAFSSSHAATIQAQLVIQNQQAMDAAATQTAIDNDIRRSQAQREANWANFMRAFPYLVTVVIMSGLVFAAAFLVYKEKGQVQVINGNVLMVKANGQDQPTIYDIGPPLIAAGAPRAQAALAAANDIVDGEFESDDVKPADWGKFTQWRDDRFLPIGITMNRRRPILINRNTEPHVIIFGGTGSGKTTSGLIPYLSAMVGAGVHAVIVNARGSDFTPFESHPGVTMAPRVDRDQAPGMLASLLSTMVTEIDRRDRVLHRYGVQSWYQLPASAGESGEFLVAVDEFLAIVVTSRTIDPKLADLFWAKLINLTSEGRKYGVFVALTMTEPTARALGNDGMTVRGQMARMGFNMKNAAASRSILDNPRGFTNGSSGLPLGQFIASVNGATQRAIAFHPTPQQVAAFLNERRGRTTLLPDEIMELTSGAWSRDASDMQRLFAGDEAEQQSRTPQPHPEAARILALYREGKSGRAIEAEVFGYTGGEAYKVVSQVTSQYG